MSDAKSGSLAFSLFKAAVFLGVGTLIGLLLGLAFASHLYGTPPVVTQVQNWFAGDSMYEGPLPVDIEGNLMKSPLALIPKIGACIGFGIAASVLSGSIFMKIFLGFLGQKPKDPSDGSLLESKAGSTAGLTVEITSESTVEINSESNPESNPESAE